MPARSSAAPLLASAASAASIIGLVDGKTLVTIDPATKKATGKADIKGATNVIGIDVRPADGMLYAVSADGTIYTVDAKSGQATMKSKMSEDAEGRRSRYVSTSTRPPTACA